jgi:outer membrane immunogenic protein
MQNLNFLSATIAISTILGVGVASAADLPARTYTKAPVVGAPVDSWTGWYVGVNGGGEWGRTDAGLGIVNNSFNAGATAAILAGSNNRIKSSGGLAGGQFGYLWQSGSFVGGLEASIDWMGARGSITQSGLLAPPANTFNESESIKTDWMALLLGRAGVDLNGWLPYVTGGLAVANLKYSNVFTTVGGIASTASISQTRAGWAAGAGLEYRLAQNWSLRGEYLYADFGSVSGTSPVVDANGIQFNLANGGLTFQHSANLRENIVRAALSYHFGGPVVAKY